MKWINEKRQDRLVGWVSHGEQGEHVEPITLAIVATVKKSREAVTFHTSQDDNLQVGVLCGAGRTVPTHRHRPVSRTTIGTMEVLLVLKGALQVCIEHQGEYQTFSLQEHQFVVIYPGVAHSVEIEEDSLIFETKNGPYAGQFDKEYVVSAKPFDPSDL